eukprot:15347184-Alexandrium_andersonii.AAC.1
MWPKCNPQPARSPSPEGPGCALRSLIVPTPNLRRRRGPASAPEAGGASGGSTKDTWGATE